MHFRYNTGKLAQIIHALSTLTGISIAFLDAQYRYLCSSTKNDDFCSAIQQLPGNTDKCKCSDQVLLNRCSQSHEYECHICHAGLYDACMPIVKEHSLAGYVLMGRIRFSAPDIQSHSIQDPTLSELYQKVPQFTNQQLASLKILLPEILFRDAIQFDDSTYEITQYIKEHLCKDLSLETICSRFHISKNVLYQRFHETHHCTVNAYITKLRIASAKALLTETTDPIYLIAEKVGVCNYTYFCRLFKSHTGVSPGQYRMKNKKEDSAK